MEFLSEYGMFLAKAITIVIAFIVIVGVVASAGHKTKKQPAGHIEILNISDEINEIKDNLQKELLSEEEYKALTKEKKKAEKEAAKLAKKEAKREANKESAKSKTVSSSDEDKEASKIAEDSDTKDSDTKDSDSEEINSADIDTGRIFVLDFEGDVQASAVENLREEISAIINVAGSNDSVIVRLESPGGMVHAYGLAASQLSRIKAAGIKLVIAVDKVAASGGYMMACVADEIIAAPFSVIGSIGVVAEIPNFHRLLKHNNVDYEQHTAGEFKRTLTMFAENTDEARMKFKTELEETHTLFKDFINQNRPDLEVEKVATGEHWYGTQALELGLVDKIQTSDDYILSAANDSKVFAVSYEVKKNLADKLTASLQMSLEKVAKSIWQRNIESRLFK